MRAKIRKAVSCMLALAMVLVLCPVMGTASSGGTDQVWWTLDAAGTLTISGSGPMEAIGFEPDRGPMHDSKWHLDHVKRVVIESGITTIMESAFGDCYEMTSVSIPDTVTKIAPYAFCGCYHLTEVHLPDSIKEIGEYAFDGCYSIEKINLPKDLEYISSALFWSCIAIQDITIPDGVTSIGRYAFANCWGLTSVVIPEGVTELWDNAFEGCQNLTSVTLPKSLTTMGAAMFTKCTSLTSITIPENVKVIPAGLFSECSALTSFTVPDGVTEIEGYALSECTSLTEVTIPASVSTIGEKVFSYDESLTDIYYGGTAEKWAEIAAEAEVPASTTVHYNSNGSKAPTPAPAPDADYLYNTEDPGKDVVLPVDMLDKIATEDDAAVAVQTLTSSMTDAQKQSATGIDLATLFAERAAALAAMVSSATGDPIQITAAQLSQVQTSMDGAAAKVASALTNGGVSAVREMAKTVVFDAGFANSVVVRIDPDVLDPTADKVRVETDKFAITFALADMAADLKNGVLEFKVEVVTGASGAAALTPKASGTSRNLTLQVTMPSGGITAPVTLSLKAGASAADYETLKLNGSATPSKYNPVTRTMDGKTMASGTYTTETNEVDFTDIQDKSAEMQAAIKSLASRGVLAGTSATEFSPDETMTRGQIAILLSRVLGVYDDRIVSTFTDVSKGSWYYVGAASCQKADLMSGSGDGKFNGDKVFSKVEIAAASSNVLTRFMGYKIPANPEQYLSRYSDTISSWATGAVALNTRENILLYRTDGKFAEGSEMTRGDVAIVIERLFSRIW